MVLLNTTHLSPYSLIGRPLASYAGWRGRLSPPIRCGTRRRTLDLYALSQGDPLVPACNWSAQILRGGAVRVPGYECPPTPLLTLPEPVPSTCTLSLPFPFPTSRSVDPPPPESLTATIWPTVRFGGHPTLPRRQNVGVAFAACLGGGKLSYGMVHSLPGWLPRTDHLPCRSPPARFHRHTLCG